MTSGVVVGASGGIGGAAASALAPSVDQLVVAGRRREALEALAAELDNAAIALVDLETERAGDEIAGVLAGELAWVVMAAGVPLRTPLAEATPAQILHAFRVNVVGPTLLLRRLLSCAWSSPGRIVIVGSVSATRTLPDRAVYAATKAGLEHLGRSLAAELAPRDILVNVVAPGVIDTAFLGDAHGAVEAWVNANVPAARPGTAEEVAEMIRYLAVEAPGYVTGARIAVDGGVEARA